MVTWCDVIYVCYACCRYNSAFKLYITTKLPNPHYSPEIFSRVSVINFTITPDGLLDQLLCVTVEKVLALSNSACFRFNFHNCSQERPELETERQDLILSTTRLQKELVELESSILKLLSEASGDILEDEVLIQTLSQSKIASEDVSSALEKARVTEKRINDTRILCV